MKTNIYKDYKGQKHKYYMYSDWDTPERHEAQSILNANSQCGLTTCYQYKTCNLVQQNNGKVKCINYKHHLRQ